ncbi:hypothetical protein RHMOL_Rhmol02G0054300 [Rhododendron molle]|uniref:Uncharacterized protein n=1 Tax=Rhododendron molle TaxID=49168 RepID=A0ACC0PNK6_RHOML|nr:hypothetical protein RHMOL_Rhmol02G0054300 [Rhododendron molle]
MRDPVIVATGRHHWSTGATPFLPDSDLSLFHKPAQPVAQISGFILRYRFFSPIQAAEKRIPVDVGMPLSYT